MFSFLAPMFFYAGAGIAISVPLALHLLQSSRTVKMPFSTIRFLKLAEKKSSRRVKMENLILWLLRTMLMMMLALAFGIPMIRTSNFGSFIGRSKRFVGIVIDVSYSMDYRKGKDSVWSTAIEAATAIVEGLNDGDEVCLFLADEDMKPVVEQLTDDKDFVIAQIRGLKSGFSSSKLAPALMAANDALEAKKGNMEKELHLITDNQALPWNSFGRGDAAATAGADEEKGTEGKDKPEEKKEDGKKKDKNAEEEASKAVTITGWDPAKIGDKTVVFVSLLGATAPENVAPADVDVSPKLIMADMPSKIAVNLAHCGPPRNTTVTVFLDDEELQSRSIMIGAEGAGQAVFTLPPMVPGAHTARIELPEDNLNIDNTFHFLFKVKEFLPTLCIGDRTDSLFLMKAMTVHIGNKSPINVKLISPGEVASENLSKYSCVFVCNALPVSGQEIVSLEQYARAGGLLIIFPGDRAKVADYEPWSCLPAKPIAVQDLSVAQRKQMLRWEKPQHTMLRELRVGEGGAPIITIRRYLHFNLMEKDTEVLVSAGSEKPFILDREFGLGHVLLFNVSADRTWSSLPLSPYFLPFVHQVVQYGAGMGGFVPYVWATPSLLLQEYLPEASRDSVITNPEGKEVSIRSSILENKTIFHAEDIMAPGIYNMKQPGETEASPAMAVNIPRDESNLTPVDLGRIRDLTGLKRIYVCTSKDDLMKQIDDHRMGKTLGETCLWLALIVAALEFFYANMRTKTPPKLTEALGIEATGQVTG